jgi:hypothetical protein
MSRRHHGRPHHGRHRNDQVRPEPGARPPQRFAVDAAAPQPRPPEPAIDEPTGAPPPSAEPPVQPLQAPTESTAPTAPTAPIAPTNGHFTNGHANNGPRASAEPTDRPTNGAPLTQDERPNGCTAPQLRRFIKSRPYVPMHELRRRFAIDGGDDDVTQVRLEDGHVYVGLPQREGSLLGELLRGGEIGYELSFDPRAPIVVGVYPMRPVPRP